MKKQRVIRFTAVLLCMSILFASIPFVASAFSSFEVEVTKDDAPLRKGIYFTSKTIESLDKGEKLTVVGEERNIFYHLWYEIEGGGYIYSGNVKEVHICKNEFVGYSPIHPHSAMYECSCGKPGYCSVTDKTTLDTCTLCKSNIETTYDSLPNHEHNYLFVGYEQKHPHYASYQCSGCVSGYSTNETGTIDSCSKCVFSKEEPVHQHEYSFLDYEVEHPHYSIFLCSCGDVYISNTTNEIDDCEICFPHFHSYEFIGYETLHPHSAMYECSCGSGYCTVETNYVTDCSICNPIYNEDFYEDEYEDCDDEYCEYESSHDYRFVGYEAEHPHYMLYQCIHCTSFYSSLTTTEFDDCIECKSQNNWHTSDDHKHYYYFIGYIDEHPHFAEYECECGDGYYDNEVIKVEWCDDCYPELPDLNDFSDFETSCPREEPIGDHTCVYEFSGSYDMEHPHYAIMECYFCNESFLDSTRKGTGRYCLECNYNFTGIGYKEIQAYNIHTGEYTLVPIMYDDESFSLSEIIHTALDVCGMVEGVGTVCDGVNAVYYLLEDNIEGFILSGASAIPFAGIYTTTGKIIKKSGYILLDTATNSAKLTIKKVITNLDNFSSYAKTLLKGKSPYVDEIAEALADISANKDLPIEKVFKVNNALISDKYTGTITSAAGLKYLPGTKQGHRVLHVLQRHSPSYQNISTATNFFNVDGEEIFKLIDDAYLNHTPIVGSADIRGNTISYDYNMNRVIGTQGETKMRVVYEGINVISAYPIN